VQEDDGIDAPGDRHKDLIALFKERRAADGPP
jgi:hypothetical protein